MRMDTFMRKNIQRAKDYLNTLYDKGISFDAVVTLDDSLAVGAVKYAYEHRIAIRNSFRLSVTTIPFLPTAPNRNASIDSKGGTAFR